MILRRNFVAGDSGLCCLPGVEGIELGGVASSRGCEERVGIVDELGVWRRIRERGGEEEGGGYQERRGEHGDR